MNLIDYKTIKTKTMNTVFCGMHDVTWLVAGAEIVLTQILGF